MELLRNNKIATILAVGLGSLGLAGCEQVHKAGKQAQVPHYANGKLTVYGTANSEDGTVTYACEGTTLVVDYVDNNWTEKFVRSTACADKVFNLEDIS